MPTTFSTTHYSRVIGPFSAITTDETTPVLLFTYDPPDNTSANIKVVLNGAEITEPAGYGKIRVAACKKVAGTTTFFSAGQVVGSDNQDHSVPASAALAFSVVSNVLNVTITGRLTDTIYWAGWAYITIGPVG